MVLLTKHFEMFMPLVEKKLWYIIVWRVNYWSLCAYGTVRASVQFTGTVSVERSI